MLYRTLKRMIERGQTNGLEEKIDESRLQRPCHRSRSRRSSAWC